MAPPCAGLLRVRGIVGRMFLADGIVLGGGLVGLLVLILIILLIVWLVRRM